MKSIFTPNQLKANPSKTALFKANATTFAVVARPHPHLLIQNLTKLINRKKIVPKLKIKENVKFEISKR